MKGLETALFALTLVAVPMLGWLVGRAMGRRDWKIIAVLFASVWVAALPLVLRSLSLVLLDGRGTVVVHEQLIKASQAPEIGFFFLSLSIFMTMLGWTSTPVKHKA